MILGFYAVKKFSKYNFTIEYIQSICFTLFISKKTVKLYSTLFTKSFTVE